MLRNSVGLCFKRERAKNTFRRVRNLIHLTLIVNLIAMSVWLANPTAVRADYVSTAINRIFIDPADMPVVANGYQVGDEISFIMETTPQITGGDTVGAGAWGTAYIPAGVLVVGAELVAANADGTYSARPAKDVANMPVDCGTRGCQLTGTELQTNVIGNGGMGYNQQDTGIFYSTDSRTALLGAATLVSPTGPTVTPQHVWNQWDVDQVNAFGIAAALSGNGGRGNTPVVSYNGGATWFGAGSPVAGPDVYYTHDYKPGAACLHVADTSTIAAAVDDFSCVGPWQRIQYDNSKIAQNATTVPVAVQTANAGVYVNNGVVTTSGYALSSSTPLPATTNAIRFVQGLRRVGDLEYSRVTLKITDATAFMADISSGTKFCMDSTGGDHDISDGGADKDNVWRYYEGDNHACFKGDVNATLFKQAKYVNGAPSNGGTLQPNDVIGYEITFYNTGSSTLNNIVITDDNSATTPNNITLVAAGTAGCPYSSYDGNQAGQPTLLSINGAGTVATWNPLASLAAGQSVTVYMCGQVTATMLGDQVRNKALASYSGSVTALSSSTLGTVAPKISGTVYYDADGSTNYTAGDTPLSGVTIGLYDSTGTTLIATTTTSAAGYYEFNGMANGAYVIKETDPTGYVSTGDTQGALTDNQIAVTIAAGSFSSGNNFFDQPAPPSIAKAFSPNPILAGGTSVLTFTITNSSPTTTLTGVSFTDNLPAAPAQMAVANPAGASTNCGGTVTATAGATSISLAGGTVAPSSTCTVTVNVTAPTASATTYDNSVTLNVGATSYNTASAALTVTAAPAASCSVNLAVWNFDNLAVASNVTAPAYSYKAGNVTTALAAAGAGIISAPNPQIEANGNPTNNWRSTQFSTAATLNTANNDYFEFSVDTTNYASILFKYDSYRSGSGPQRMTLYYSTDGVNFVTSAAVNTIGTAYSTYTIDLSAIAALNNNPNAKFRIYGYQAGGANGVGRIDNVTICAPLLPPSMTKAFSPTTIPTDGTSTLTFTVANPNASTALNGVAFSDVYPASLVNAAAPAVTNTCGGTVTALAGDVGLSLIGGSIPGGGSCAVTVNVTSSTQSTYNNTSGAVSSTNGGVGNTANASVLVADMNFGHLPSTYTAMNLYAEGGAGHLSGTTMFGSALTTATDGINTATYTPKASDDGVTFSPSTPWSVAAGGSLDITVTCSSPPCYMNAWFDFNKNGDFNDPGEQIFTNYSFSASGTTRIPFSIPAGTTLDGTFYSRFRLYNQLPTGAQPGGLALNGSTPLSGEIEDPFFNITGGVVTPVTLSWFKSEQQGGQVQFNWATATETGNVGFNLYVERGGNLEMVNAELIPSSVIDSLERRDYAFFAPADGDIFYIEDVSVTGETRRHGPFALGEEFGSLDESDPIDWNAVAAGQTPQAPLQSDLIRAAGQQAALNLKVRQTGLYRVTYEMLSAAGLDLVDVNPARIMLTLYGRAVPIYVYTPQETFGPGGYIEFHGRALNTLYTDTNIYTLKVSPLASPRIAVSNIAPSRVDKPVATYLETLVVDNQRAYTNYTPGTDAWYDNYVFVQSTAASMDFPFEVSGLANSTTASTLNLTLWGMIEMPQLPDHHVVVSVNGVQVASQTFDGLVEHIVQASIPAGVLKNGPNTLTLTLPADTGAAYDLVYLDKFSVTYPHLFRAQDGRLTFTAAGKVFRVNNLPTPNVVVYQLVKNRPVRVAKVTVKASGATYMATFAGSTTATTYLVSTAEAMLAPELAAVPTPVSLDQPAQYLIIAHPDFISGIQPLVQAREAQGLTVSVVNVNDLYAKYTFGVFDPKAIQKHIAYAAQNLGAQYVLLVGGDTYDYRNFLGKNSISFIPSLYVATSSVAKFVPADPLYTDLNGDKIPDLAIGRFPVRTAAELELMVNKTLAYQNKDYGRTAVFATDKMDGALSFKGISAGMSASLPSGWSVENIHLDDLSVPAAQTQLLTAMNRGVALVSFTGHSGPTKWTFSGLFGTKNIPSLTNAGRPFVVVQWGCWNTYYVDPVNNYLVQSFLFSGDKGAAAVLGASTLTDSASEALLGNLLMPRLVTPGMSIGQALQDAKRQLARTHPQLLDVLLGWSLMGDPALVIEP